MSKRFKTSGISGLCRRFLLVFVALMVAIFSDAQPSRRIQRWFDEARQHLSRREYLEAIALSEQILERDAAFLDARLLLADIYFETEDSPNEILHLEKALEISTMPLILRRLGDAFFATASYAKALDYYQRYLDSSSLSSEGKAAIGRKMENCRFAIQAMRNPVDFKPERLPETVNSPYDDYWPSLSIDQQQLVITRLMKEPGRQPQEDFYISEYGANGWENAKPLKEINTPENEGAQSLSADGKLLFFTACNRPGGMGSCDIYYSVRSNRRWGTPVNAGKPVNTGDWEAQPSISSDGRFLYFSSNRPGGKGNKDLWRAECLGFDQNGRLKWREPENLGDSINTPGNETSPFVHAGNANFYFASDYHIGMGGFDLFMSHILNDSVFSRPQNLGYPINTVNDEQGLHISADGLTAFFSSARDTLSKLDIYSFQLDESIRPQPATYVKATVTNSDTREPVQASVRLVNLAVPDEPGRVANTDKQGELLVCLPTGVSYSFSVSKEGYLFYSNIFDLEKPRQIYNPYELEIGLTPVKVGAEMDLHNIYFETDSFRILPRSEPELRKLITFLTENPVLKVEVQGHTDNTGRTENNRDLSEKRAQSVVGFLVSRGIDQDRLMWAGYGEDRPVATNETEEGRRLNRRTTIKILGE